MPVVAVERLIEEVIKEYLLFGIHLLEMIGALIIVFASIKTLIHYVQYRGYHKDSLRIELAQGLAFGLEFKLGGEILRTLIIRDIQEVMILGSIILLRGILSYIIHWEMERD